MSKSAVVSELLWTEKYRPTSLEDVAMNPADRMLIQSYLDKGEIPHLLLIGPPGSGKTTIARILIEGINCMSLSLNASAERGIDVVRDKIGSFVTSMLSGDWNIPFLDEADHMTADAQTALRNMMEAYSDRARFILTGNFPHRIIAPIQSRCQIITLNAPDLKERYRILAKVLLAEGIQADPKVVLTYADRYTDMRRMLFAAQKAFLSTGSAALPPATQTGAVTGAEMFEFLVQKNWTKFRGLTMQGDFDALQALRELFWAVPDEHQRAGFLRHTLGKAVHETGFTPDPVILFLGVVSEAMDGLK